MTDGTIRFRRRRLDKRFWCILMSGLPAALALHIWLYDLLGWSFAPASDRTVPRVDNSRYQLLTPMSAGRNADR